MCLLGGKQLVYLHHDKLAEHVFVLKTLFWQLEDMYCELINLSEETSDMQQNHAKENLI